MTAQAAKHKIQPLIGKKVFIEGAQETIEDYTINGQIVIIYTNKKHRKCQLSSLEHHLTKYTPALPKPVPPSLAPVKEIAKSEPKEEPKPQPKISSGHAEAEHKIYFTRDFARFKNILGNRILNDAKIKRIMADIKAGINMLPWCPIIVDEQMNVIDGQHRLAVAKKTNENIYYLIRKQSTLHEIARMNSNTERWKGADFIHCYSVQGNTNYKQLKDFMAKYSFPLTTSLHLLSVGKVMSSGDHKIRADFETGRFMVQHLEYSVSLAEQVHKFKAHAGYTSRAFITAIQLLMGSQQCDFDHLLKKFGRNPESLPLCSTHKEYLTALEAVYNKDAKHRTTIF